MNSNILTFTIMVAGLFSTPVLAEKSFSADTNNLLINGSFEEGEYSPTTNPVGWNKDPWLPADMVWDNTQSRTGSKSVKIDAATPNDVRWLQTVDVVPETVYFLSGWIKTDQVAHDSGPVVAGANLSLYGTWQHTAGVFGTSDWARNGLLFNSEDNHQITAAARLGYWSGTAIGTAWFDDLRLERIVPMDPHPVWKILVLIYRDTDFEATDSEGSKHRFVASMTHEEAQRAAAAARQFVEVDIPALTSGNMVPEVTIRLPDHALTRLSAVGDGWWPSPEDTAPDRDPAFDSVIVIWDTRATDVETGEAVWIGWGDGLTANLGAVQTYLAMQIDAAINRGHRNVFKHEWGHSILFFFDAIGSSPEPQVTNHALSDQYVNCRTGQYYVWEDETLVNPIPNSTYNNDSGFTHDYYSGETATAEDPIRCLGVPPEAWALGGPVSHSGNLVDHDVVGVDVDIKPYGPPTKPNKINLRSRHSVWVAVLSDPSLDTPFDPTSQVDLETVRFGPEEAIPKRYKVRDTNRDGIGDLLMKFRIMEAGIACGDTEATLTGNTFNGQRIAGTDSIKTVGCKYKKKHHKKGR